MNIDLYHYLLCIRGVKHYTGTQSLYFDIFKIKMTKRLEKFKISRIFALNGDITFVLNAIVFF